MPAHNLWTAGGLPAELQRPSSGVILKLRRPQDRHRIAQGALQMLQDGWRRGAKVDPRRQGFRPEIILGIFGKNSHYGFCSHTAPPQPQEASWLQLASSWGHVGPRSGFPAAPEPTQALPDSFPSPSRPYSRGYVPSTGPGQQDWEPGKVPFWGLCWGL